MERAWGAGDAVAGERVTAEPADRVATPVAVVASVVLLTLLRLLLMPRLGLFNDEAYYWEWSRRLAASYFDHPPLVAWILAASTRLLGWTQLAVHLPGLVFSCATSVVLYRFALDLFPGRRDVAWWTVLTLNVAPLFALSAVFTTPDAPTAFLWALTAWLVWRAVSGSPRLWYLAGVTAGLGLLSKYTFGLLPLAVFLFLLRPAQRAWLRRKEPWIAAAIATALFTPVLVWNARHGWASFSFHLVERHSGEFQPWRTIPRFLAAQQSLSPLIWLACVAALVRSYRLGRRGDERHAFLFWCAAVILALFAGWSLFTYVNPNWFAPGFITLLIPASALVLEQRSRLARVLPAALGALVTLAFYVQSISLVVPLPPRTDFATDLVGWPEVGERLRAERDALPDPARAFVYSHRLQLSALAAFYGGDGLPVMRLGGRRDAYDDWTDRSALRGRDAVYFCDDWHYANPEEPFRRCDNAGELRIVRHDRRVRTFFFWRCVDLER
jgi:4-amino-4-deoxy-L-arabinose transferase-like glycosyltransferase